MRTSTHPARDFLLGAAIAAALLAVVWFTYPGPWRHPGEDPIQAARDRREQLRAAAEARQAAAAPTPRPAADARAPAAPGPGPVVQATACVFDPLLRRSSSRDGLFSPAAALRMPQPAGAHPFVAVSREAAQQGRSRDAEAALIVACRLQSREPSDPVQLADIQSELARRYLDAVRAQPPGAPQDQLAARARSLLATAVQAYEPAGEDDRVREARVMLAQLEAASLGNGPLGGQEEALANARDTAPAQDAAQRGGAVRDDAVPGRPEPVDTRVAQDPELAQLDADLSRLRAQARSVTDQPEAFRRREAAARARRDACADRACLLRWYAERRRQLIDEF